MRIFFGFSVIRDGDVSESMSIVKLSAIDLPLVIVILVVALIVALKITHCLLSTLDLQKKD